jgi:hypothetical protein
MRRPGRWRQAGIALPFLAISAAMLMGFVALVVDIGRLSVVRTEVQSAADSCALAALADLDRTNGQLTRADASGRHAAALLPAGFQQTASGANQTTATLRFATGLNGVWVDAASVSVAEQSANYRTVECRVTHPGVRSFFARAVGASVDGALAATARAHGVPAQRACVLPLALERANPLAVARPWGLAANTVYYLVKPAVSLGVLGLSVTQLGYTVRLVDFTVAPGSAVGASTASIVAQVGTGICDVDLSVRPNQRAPLLTTSSDLDSVWGPWNARFGVYQAGSNLMPSVATPNTGLLPDITGWAPAPPPLIGTLSLTIAPESGRFQGNSGDNYQTNAGLRTVMPVSARPNAFAPSPAAGNHRELGASGRRLVVLPVTRPASNLNAQMRDIVDYACVWLYRPIGEDSIAVTLGLLTYKLSWAVEFLGFANAPDSPCRSHGLPGASTSLGPLVPALVQ